MKRISNIVNPKGIPSERFARKEERILRQVEQAIDSVKDQIADKEEETETLIDSLGTAAEATCTAKVQSILNTFCQKKDEIATLNNYVGYLKELKAELNKDVEITVVTTPVEIVNISEK
jgi:hypothetical protein